VNNALPPSIVLHPVGQEAEVAGTAQFVVAVNGQGPFTYQWRRNGLVIPGANGATLTLTRVAASDFADYDVVVSNAAGSSTSETARLNQKTTSGGGDPRDYGDAPDLPYPTTLAHGGASQRVLTGFMLGGSIDADNGNQQNADATADGADEDGVQFLNPFVPGQAVTIRVIYKVPPNHAPGRLSAWIDWGDDGSWAEFGDRIITHRELLQQTNDFLVVVPPGAVLGQTFSRFRLYEDNFPDYAGEAEDAGEVEDYAVTITRSGGGGGTGGGDATMDFGDAPDSYLTLEASNGARHVRDPELYLGKSVDVETNGVPTNLAIGDDVAGQPDDEDGVSGSPFLVPGRTAIIDISVTGTGIVDAWLDFDRSGTFAEAGERIVTSLAFASETKSISFMVPAGANPGTTYARFRLSRQGTGSWSGSAPDGEVEDYVVLIVEEKKDWGDAPSRYPTTEANGGARHVLVEDFHFGKSIDAESDGQPTGNATGDDSVPAGDADDEDGIYFTGPLIPGQQAQVEIEVSEDGRLDAWVDFGDDGDWSQANDRIFTNRTLSAGVNNLTFDVPANAALGPTFARFRLSRAGLNTFTGDGGEGEVEDHRVVIERDTGCTLTCAGTDFWLAYPGNYAPDPATPVEPRLRFTGTAGTTVTVAIPGLATTVVTNIAAGGGATVVLPAGVDLGALNDAVLNRGVHVTSTAPVSVFVVSRVPYTSDGYLGLATETLSGEYVISAFPNKQVGVPETSGTQFAVVATQPNTTV
ncbi:MAG: hypothetical protein JNL97_00150, partial [Verrucomicrobiales bacterium]|nr:hypothetical protein [Verrucomicrobiales bacterium]